MPITSTQISALNGGYQSMHMGQMAHASMIGQQQTMYGGGRTMGEGMMGSMANIGQSMAPMAGMGAMVAGVDPLSMGVRAGMAAGGAGGMGALGGAAVGGAVALPMIAGAMAARYGAGQMMRGAQQQQQFNVMMRQNYGYLAGPGGGGLGAGTLGNMGQAMRGMAGPTGPGGGMVGFEELGRLAANMGRMGMAQGVRNAKDFSEKFKQMVTTLKEVAEHMGTSLEEAQKMMAGMKSAGVFGMTRQARVAGQVAGAAFAGGLATSEVTAMMGTGAQISRMIGGRGFAGQQAGRRAITTVGVAGRLGILSEEQIADITGQTGAAGRQAMATRMLQQSARFLRGQEGTRIVAALAGQGGDVDPEAMEEFMAGGMTGGRTMQLAQRNLARMGRAAFERNKGRIRGQILAAGGGLVQAQALRGWYEQRAPGMDPDRMMVLMQRKMGRGTTMEQTEAMMGLVRALPEITRERAAMGEEREMMQRITARQQTRGLEGLKRRFEGAKSAVQNRLQQMGADFMSSGAEMIDRFVTQLTGEYQETYERDAMRLYEGAVQGGARGRALGRQFFGVGGGLYGGQGGVYERARQQIFGGAGGITPTIPRAALPEIAIRAGLTFDPQDIRPGDVAMSDFDRAQRTNREEAAGRRAAAAAAPGALVAPGGELGAIRGMQMGGLADIAQAGRAVGGFIGGEIERLRGPQRREDPFARRFREGPGGILNMLRPTGRERFAAAGYRINAASERTIRAGVAEAQEMHMAMISEGRGVQGFDMLRGLGQYAQDEIKVAFASGRIKGTGQERTSSFGNLLWDLGQKDPRVLSVANRYERASNAEKTQMMAAIGGGAGTLAGEAELFDAPELEEFGGGKFATESQRQEAVGAAVLKGRGPGRRRAEEQGLFGLGGFWGKAAMTTTVSATMALNILPFGGLLQRAAVKGAGALAREALGGGAQTRLFQQAIGEVARGEEYRDLALAALGPDAESRRGARITLMDRMTELRQAQQKNPRGFAVKEAAELEWGTSILVAQDMGDVTNDDGSIDPERLKEVAKRWNVSPEEARNMAGAVGGQAREGFIERRQQVAEQIGIRGRRRKALMVKAGTVRMDSRGNLTLRQDISDRLQDVGPKVKLAGQEKMVSAAKAFVDASVKKDLLESSMNKSRAFAEGPQFGITFQDIQRQGDIQSMSLSSMTVKSARQAAGIIGPEAGLGRARRDILSYATTLERIEKAQPGGRQWIGGRLVQTGGAKAVAGMLGVDISKKELAEFYGAKGTGTSGIATRVLDKLGLEAPGPYQKRLAGILEFSQSTDPEQRKKAAAELEKLKKDPVFAEDVRKARLTRAEGADVVGGEANRLLGEIVTAVNHVNTSVQGIPGFKPPGGEDKNG